MNLKVLFQHLFTAHVATVFAQKARKLVGGMTPSHVILQVFEAGEVFAADGAREFRLYGRIVMN